MSKMLRLLPDGHAPCFFLLSAFLKCFLAEVRAPLVHDRTSNSLTSALCTDEIFQSRVSATSAVNHVSSAQVLGEELLFMLSALQPLLVLLMLPPLVPVLAVLLLLHLPLTTPPLPLCAGITDLTVISPRSVVLPAPGPETSE